MVGTPVVEKVLSSELLLGGLASARWECLDNGDAQSPGITGPLLCPFLENLFLHIYQRTSEAGSHM